MKANKKLIALALLPLALSASVLSSCGGTTPGNNPGGNEGENEGENQGGNQSEQQSDSEYVNSLKEYSVANHVYVHYYRFAQTAADFNKFDLWAWPYRPKEGQGVRFDWKGRTTDSNGLTATGNTVIDGKGFATADIDLTKAYKGGWNASTKEMGGIDVNFTVPQDDEVVKIGLQFVLSEARTSGGGFWKNDGGNIYADLSKFAFKNSDNSTSYHIFATQDSAANLKTVTDVAGDFSVTDPYANDDGTNFTYGKQQYVNANFATDKALKETSESFKTDAGVGYQVMVSSFADSDGDGFGDIYGITQKLDYLQELGVNVLWLTPIQKSDSYHGYDISDYLAVDPKFGSTTSTAALANNGVVTDATASADYKELIDKAHEKGMKVIMDLVINHTATTNEWFVNSSQLEETMRAYYQWGNHETDATNINEDKYWYPYGDHAYSYYAKFGSSMPELNYQYQATRDAVRDIALNWCEIGVDGFRMDAVKHIFMEEETFTSLNDTIVVDETTKEGKPVSYSSNLTKNLNFWKELNYEVKKEYPNAYFVGENFDGHAYHVAPYYEGFDSLFDFYSYFNLTSIASGKTNVYAASWAGAFDSSKAPEQGYVPSSDASLKGNKTSSTKYSGQWSLNGVLQTNNQYRTGGTKASSTTGYESLPGMFTSNHDIARTINRVAGTDTNSDGLTAQGKVTTSNYNDMNKRATLVQIAELMLPGTTYIYYGDELGMTGNFEAGVDANTGYADLAYRQPMKWTANGEVGDGSMTTGYGISGSDKSVKMDEVNASSSVKSVAERNDSEHFNAIKKFANLKSSNETLIRGLYTPTAEILTQQDNIKKNVLDFQRTLGNETYRVIVNFGSDTYNFANGKGTILETFGTANLKAVAGYSAVVIKDGSNPDVKPETVKVTVTMAENSSIPAQLNVYAWDDLQTNNASWPGQRMSYDEATKTFSLDIDASFTHIIFNDGTKQTVDLDFSKENPTFVLKETSTGYALDGTEEKTITITLDVNGNWSSSKVGLWCWGNGISGMFMNMTKNEETGLFEVSLPEGVTGLKFMELKDSCTLEDGYTSWPENQFTNVMANDVAVSGEGNYVLSSASAGSWSK